MHLTIYLILLLFVIHSALLLSSDAISILAIFMLVLLLCAFLTCLIQRYLIEGTMETEEGKVTLKLRKRGFLPVFFIRSITEFTYDQTGLTDTQKGNFSLPSKGSSVSFGCDLNYAGSGIFSMKKCSVTDFFGFFSLPIKDKNEMLCYVDLFPEEKDIDFYAQNSQVNHAVGDKSITVDLIGDDSSETLQLHEYHPGDVISRTHWKLSAKRDIRMIRDFARENDCRYLFALSFEERDQQKFHKIIFNFYNISLKLISESLAHTVIWADSNGDVFEENISTLKELDNTIYMIFHSFDDGKEIVVSRKDTESAKMFAPCTGEVLLEEYLARSLAANSVQKFVITDEPLSELQRRWADENL